MRHAFDPSQGLITIGADISGPRGTVTVKLALDTGATRTLLNTGVLTSLGYDPASSPERVYVTTGSGVEYAPLVRIEKLTCLGEDRTGFDIVCHTLPPSAGINGLLGLDFLRNRKLTVDFTVGTLCLQS